MLTCPSRPLSDVRAPYFVLQWMPKATAELLGLLVIGQGHTLADVYHMLVTEFQLRPTGGNWCLACVDARGTKVAQLSDAPADIEVLHLLPQRYCDLHVTNCERYGNAARSATP